MTADYLVGLVDASCRKYAVQLADDAETASQIYETVETRRWDNTRFEQRQRPRKRRNSVQEPVRGSCDLFRLQAKGRWDMFQKSVHLTACNSEHRVPQILLPVLQDAVTITVHSTAS